MFVMVPLAHNNILIGTATQWYPPPLSFHFLSVYFFPTFNTSWIMHHKWTLGLCPTH